MKVLFLDIDGVVNSEETFRKDPNAFFPIDPYLAFLVGKIVLETDCVVVLSSSWRHHDESVDHIEKKIVKIFDRTPSLPRGEDAEYCGRGKEIKAWMDEHDGIEKYAILDDDPDMLPWQMANFFRTSWKKGITEEIAEKVIRHLK